MHGMALADLADAYRIFSSKRDNCITTMLVPPRAGQPAVMQGGACGGARPGNVSLVATARGGAPWEFAMLSTWPAHQGSA